MKDPGPDRATRVAELKDQLQATLRTHYTPPFEGATFEWFENSSVAQTLMFYIDLVPYLHHVLSMVPWGQELSILDAGCGSGAGADLLGRLQRPEFLGHRYTVTGIDLVETFKEYAEVAYPNMRYLVGDVCAIPNNAYDVVVCSHVIEHFVDPTEFMQQLIRVGRICTIFYCPFEEKQLLLPGHVRSIDREFINNFHPAFVDVRASLGWRHPYDEKSECVLFIVPGTDWNTVDVPSVERWSQGEPLIHLRGDIMPTAKSIDSRNHLSPHPPPHRQKRSALQLKIRALLKSAAKSIPPIQRVIHQRNTLLAEQDTLLARMGELLGQNSELRQQLRESGQTLALSPGGNPVEETPPEPDDSLLWRMIMQDRSVDMITLGPYINIVHTDDQWYKDLPDQYKNRSVHDLAAHHCESLPTVEDVGQYLETFDIQSNPLYYLASVFAQSYPGFCYCDIGAQYGTTAMDLARFFRSIGAKPR